MKAALIAGAVAMGLAVMLGAFGAHGLKQRLPDPSLLAVYQTGVQYHFYHAIGLLCVGLLGYQTSNHIGLYWVTGLMLLGILLFSGSLYLMAITNLRWLGAITPIGGVAFIVAWIWLVVWLLKLKTA